MEPEITDIDTKDEYHEPTVEIEAKYTDGTGGYFEFELSESYKLQRLLRKLLEDDQSRMVARLSTQDKKEYDRFTDESECRCDGSCSIICWYSMQEREHWLNERAVGGVIVEWRWRMEDGSNGPFGSADLNDFNTIIDEGMGLAGDIVAPVM